MKYSICFILTITTLTCFAQKKHWKDIKPVYAAYDSTNRTSILPNDLFSGHIDGIVTRFNSTSKSYNNPTYSYEIFWPAPAIDGSCVLEINKRQIVLTTGHDNPNPDMIYWFTNITPKQFQNIIKEISLKHNLFKEQKLHYCYTRQLDYKNYVAELPIPKKWTNKIVDIHNADHQKKTYDNAIRLINLFNMDANKGEQIHFPNFDEFRKMQPIYTAQRADELTWIKRLK